MHYLLLTILGLLVGILSGFLGIGGGTVLIPLLVPLGYSPIQAAATSSLAVAITATSGSIQNLKMGEFSFQRVLALGFPALITSQVGVYLARQMDAHLLLISFDALLLLNIYLVELRKRLTQKQGNVSEKNISDLLAKINHAKAEIFLAGWITTLGGFIILVELILMGQSVKASFKLFLVNITITPFAIVLMGLLMISLGLLLDSPKLWNITKSKITIVINSLNIILLKINFLFKIKIFSLHHFVRINDFLRINKRHRIADVIASSDKTELAVFKRKIDTFNFLSYLVEAKSEIIIAGFSILVSGIITWFELLRSQKPLQALVNIGFLHFTITPFQIIVFGAFLLIFINLTELVQRLISIEMHQKSNPNKFKLIASRIFVGGAAGLLAGLFGVGGGVILVPLQLLLLDEPLKTAIRTSLGVIIITSVSACLGHALNGNLLFIDGFLIGIGGLVGARISSRFLVKISEQFISTAFRILLATLFVYTAFLAVSMDHP